MHSVTVSTADLDLILTSIATRVRELEQLALEARRAGEVDWDSEGEIGRLKALAARLRR